MPAGTRSIKIYRTKANGTQLFYLASVAGNVATYRDTTPDANLVSFVAPYDGQGQPFPTTFSRSILGNLFAPSSFSPNLTGVSTTLPGQGLAQQTSYDYAFVYVNGRDTIRIYRLVAVPVTRANPAPTQRLSDLPATQIDEIEHFFVSYNQAHGRTFKPIGRGGPDVAESALDAAAHRYRQMAKV